ncbi:hypothetical protein INR49_018237 [Caranx melampygus]|nr:hypothetical protein INR49_018237 [Caranx melampygus]
MMTSYTEQELNMKMVSQKDECRQDEISDLKHKARQEMPSELRSVPMNHETHTEPDRSPPASLPGDGPTGCLN